jgi:hypothetical protein
VYAGDTALHPAAAYYESANGRRAGHGRRESRSRESPGALSPFTYAVDGGPGSVRCNPGAQRATVLCVLQLGADPNAFDEYWTAPLPVAVRTDAQRPSRRYSTGAQILTPPTEADPRDEQKCRLARLLHMVHRHHVGHRGSRRDVPRTLSLLQCAMSSRLGLGRDAVLDSLDDERTVEGRLVGSANG